MVSSRKSVLVLAYRTPLSELERTPDAACASLLMTEGSVPTQVTAVRAASDHAVTFLATFPNRCENTLMVYQSFLCCFDC